MKMDKITKNILKLIKYELSFSNTEVMDINQVKELISDLEIHLSTSLHDDPDEVKRLSDEYLYLGGIDMNNNNNTYVNDTGLEYEVVEIITTTEVRYRQKDKFKEIIYRTDIDNFLNEFSKKEEYYVV